MSNESLVERMQKYINERNILIAKIGKAELVSNCCSYPMPDTDIDICGNCGEHCKIIDLNKDQN